MRIAILDPFFDESHKSWAEGLIRHSAHQYDLITLSAHHWKWKMASGAIYCADVINKSMSKYNLIIATDMVNVSLLKATLVTPNNGIPIALYFHENQISYPWAPNPDFIKQDRDKHYGWINFTSALTADSLLFNSEYHKSSFFTALPVFLSQFPSSPLPFSMQDLRDKSDVLPLGIEAMPHHAKIKKNKIPIIIWNHRWEKDKNPGEFFRALYELKKSDVAFKLILCGKRYDQVPIEFVHAREDFAEEIIHDEFTESREQYTQLLNAADIALVTSHQDFFGISVVECIAGGCYPILPNRLAYPEHIPTEYAKEHFYDDHKGMMTLLKKALHMAERETIHLVNHVQKYEWQNVIDLYDKKFSEIVD